jgi:DNA topoisomerase-3
MSALILEENMGEIESSEHAGLNTVELLKTASSSLSIGPHVAMRIAEQLYTAGLLSYPRTESSAYPATFEFRVILKEHTRHPIWGEYSAALLSNGYIEPKVVLSLGCG